MPRVLLPLLACLMLLTGTAQADQTLLLRQPDISDDHLVFVYAGDLWVAARDGSQPRRLTTSPVNETNPVFSPDGHWIAFNADFENNNDVYVISVDGGQPRRLTWHSDWDSPLGWTPDGKQVVMASARETDHGRSGQLYHVAREGGLPVKQMEARVVQGTYDADASHLAYIPFGSGYNGVFGGSAGWKGYRGGTTPAVWIMDLKAQSLVQVPGAGSTNFNPMYVDGSLYFVSDRDRELFNIFRYSEDGTLTRVTDEKVWEVRAAAGHDGTIVYEAGGRLKQLDLATGRTSEIVVHINPDLPQLRPEWKDAGRTIQNTDISNTGKRAIITARGEVFTVAVDEGPTRNITRTGNVREYSALWSPDGGRIAYIVDGLKGQKLVITDQFGDKQEEHKLGPHFYQLMDWSGGDEERLLFVDNHLSLFTMKVDGGKIEKIATGARREEIDASFSPDGRWLAYTQEQPNYHRDLMLRDLDSDTQVRVSDGMADVASPAFSPDGKYLYFAASTNAGPLQVGLNMSSQERPYRAGLYAVVLQADGTSPLKNEQGDEEVPEDEEEKKGEDAKDEDKDKEKDEAEDEGTRIDLEGLAQRVVPLPVAQRNYRNLMAGHDGNLYYIQAVQPGGSTEPPGQWAQQENALWRFDMEEKEAKSLMGGVNSFTFSADGKQLLLRKVMGGLAVAKAGPKLDPETVSTSGLKVRVDPREEWAVIFDEVWRMEKEYFYDPDMHGLNWDKVYKRYRSLLEHVGRREDLNDLLVEMIAEMQVGHNRVAGGDVHREKSVNCGLLGANVAIHDGHHRLEKIYTGENWNTFVAAPLAVPGNEAREGEYILAVNGMELTEKDNIWAFLQGTVGKQVTLRVGPSTDDDEARDIVVEPIRGEYGLRLWGWIEENRRRVDEASDGRLGYIYLPNTAGAGYTFFNRMFFPQVDKEALIIDERSNGGGQAANYITDVLSRRHLSGWKDRDGLVYNTPAGAHFGPKLMLIDQDAGSGGDFLPYSFRELGIGKLMGTRTWGGLIGIFANPRTMDGGVVTVPFFRFYNADHQWTVENQGVAPDLEVMLDPMAANRGVDSQLEAAIREVLSQLEGFENPIPAEAPAYPTELGE